MTTTDCMQIYALWCHPRSVSTAFERIMRERGDLNVMHEPFMYHHYLTQTERVFPDFRPEPDHPQSYEDIRDMIVGASKDQSVFIKDMAYYIDKRLPQDTAFAGAIKHAFLVRDPAESILSYHKRDTGFVRTEVGIRAQWDLYARLAELGHDPLVLTADMLRSNPEVTLSRYWEHVGLPFCAHAFGWDDSVPAGWESVTKWHAEALSSGSIKPPEQSRDYRGELAELGAPFTDFDTHHRPFFERLKSVAKQQLTDHTRHQK